MEVHNRSEQGETEQNQRSGLVVNPYISDSEEDILFHLMLSNKKNNLPHLFGDIKFVCMSGTVRRVKEFAETIRREILQYNTDTSTVEELTDYAASGHRYSMFKVGPVLCVNHGIGYASVAIVLHEVIKLLHHAAVKEPIIFRIGTSGGIGTAAGTVIIAEQAFNDFLEENLEIPILGKRMKIPAILDRKLATDLKNLSAKKYTDFPILIGKTMSHEHFYESVASVKASFCDRSDEDRKNYMNFLRSHGILNADMEVAVIAALTHQVGIKSAVINVVVNDLLHPSDNTSVEMMLEWQTRPQKVVAEYIRNFLSRNVTSK